MARTFTGTYNPLGMDVLLQLLALMLQTKMQLAEQYNTIQENYQDLELLLYSPLDAEIYKLVLDYNNLINDSVDSMFKNGLQADSLANFYKLRNTSKTLLNPMKRALENRNKQAELYATRKIQDPSLLAERDPGSVGLKEFMENPNLSFDNTYSGDRLAKDVLETLTALSKGITSTSLSGKLDKYTKTFLTLNGISLEDMQRFINGEPLQDSKIQNIILSVIDGAVNKAGIKSWSNYEDIKEKVLDSINTGLLRSVGDAKISTVEDKEAIKNLEFNTWVRQLEWAEEREKRKMEQQLLNKMMQDANKALLKGNASSNTPYNPIAMNMEGLNPTYESADDARKKLLVDTDGKHTGIPVRITHGGKLLSTLIGIFREDGSLKSKLQLANELYELSKKYDGLFDLVNGVTPTIFGNAYAFKMSIGTSKVERTEESIKKNILIAVDDVYNRYVEELKTAGIHGDNFDTWAAKYNQIRLKEGHQPLDAKLLNLLWNKPDFIGNITAQSIASLIAEADELGGYAPSQIVGALEIILDKATRDIALNTILGATSLGDNKYNIHKIKRVNNKGEFEVNKDNVELKPDDLGKAKVNIYFTGVNNDILLKINGEDYAVEGKRLGSSFVKALEETLKNENTARATYDALYEDVKELEKQPGYETNPLYLELKLLLGKAYGAMIASYESRYNSVAEPLTRTTSSKPYITNPTANGEPTDRAYQVGTLMDDKLFTQK